MCIALVDPVAGVMSKMYRITLIFIFMLIAVSCSVSSESSMEQEIEAAREKALAKIDSESCFAEGGKVEGIGLFGIPTCVKYYPDAGKLCRGSDDCIGHCFLPEPMEDGTEILGKCEASEHDSFGCFSRVENGVVAYSMCQD